MDLVVDTVVLVDASGEGVREFAIESYQLLHHLQGCDGWRLCFDKKGKIKREYDGRVSGQMFAQKWLMATQSRWFTPECVRLPKATRVKLCEIHFDTKDLPFVETAHSIATKLIVTREFTSDSPRVLTVLRRDLGVEVLRARDLLEIDAALAGSASEQRRPAVWVCVFSARGRSKCSADSPRRVCGFLPQMRVFLFSDK